MSAGEGFRPSELLLGYQDWEQLANERRERLGSEWQRWLGAWNAYDLAVSPMDDEKRSQLRFGHSLGWFARVEDKS